MPQPADGSSPRAELAPDAAPNVRGRAKRPRGLGCAIEIAETLVLTFAIFWLLQALAVQPFEVRQESMRTTFEPGQYVLVDKLTPRLSAYGRGDVVVFNPLQRQSSCDAEPSPYMGTLVPYIKRVIGVPGDTIELHGGAVYVNGHRLLESYVHGQPTLPLTIIENWTIAADRLFVLGDNRGNSVDSRSDTIGEICLRDVIGRAVLRYWPIDSFSVIARPTYSTE